MSSWVRYWMRRDQDGRVSALVRIRKMPGEGLWSEFFRNGQWHEYPPIMRYLYDPLYGDEISEEEAEEVMRELGYEWPGEAAPPPSGT